MSVKNETCGRRSAVQIEVGVFGRPEQVCQAIVTRPVFSTWLVPAEFKVRGGKLPGYIRALLTGVALLSMLASAWAQEPPKPGQESDNLKRLVGTWEAETDSGKGTMTYKMALGGLWLMGDFDGEFGGLKFQGKGLETYDPATKKYRSVWVDSFSTAPRIMEGSLDNKVMTMTGDGPGQEGKTAKYKSIAEVKDDDTINFSLFMVDKDGKELQIVKITYKRKK